MVTHTQSNVRNVQKSERCYYRSKPSTLDAIKKKVKARKGQTQNYNEVFEDTGDYYCIYIARQPTEKQTAGN